MNDWDSKAQEALARLLGIMRRLRSPDGCPWDREQDFASIAPYTIEEAYEVAEAIARGEPRALEGELGDLLFQVVFHAQMGSEKQWFDFASVADAISRKLIERHPHVFADARRGSAAELNRAWAVLGDATARRAYDRSRRPVIAGVAVPTSMTQRVPPPPDHGEGGSRLTFGRYTGWTLRDLARRDPDYLSWLSRHSSGLRYRTEIYQILRTAGMPAA